MSAKIKDPDDILSEMEEAIRKIRGGHDALVSLGDGGSDVTAQSRRATFWRISEQ